MEYPKNDIELRIFCLDLASRGGGMFEHEPDIQKANEYYEFITSSASKPSARKRRVPGWSALSVSFLRLFRHQGH